METNDIFWNAIDRIVSESKIVIDRPGGGIDIWVGKMKESKLMQLYVSLI